VLLSYDNHMTRYITGHRKVTSLNN